MSEHPLITDTVFTRIVVGVITTVLTIGAGWVVTELAAISKRGAVLIEDVRLIEDSLSEISERLNVTSSRVDRLYELYGHDAKIPSGR